MPMQVLLPPGVEELETKALRIDVREVVRRIETDLRGKLFGRFLTREQRYQPVLIDDERYSLRARLVQALGDTPKDLETIELVLKQKFPPLALPGRSTPVVKHRVEHPLQVAPVDPKTFALLTKVFLSKVANRPERDAMVTERSSYHLPEGDKVEIDCIREYRGAGEEAFRPVDIPPFLEIESPNLHRIAAIAQALGFDLEALSPWSKRDVIHHHR